ncbi:MAG TPA: hypothetical protein VM754_11565 [Actinomycetota bacterium]|nr:hypothetical protein [Actinomycetota bacterium]
MEDTELDPGLFPFGRPNSPRPSRRVPDPKAMVIGVYPSAFHVSWTAPEYTWGKGPPRRIKALAVDVEPAVFWEGGQDEEKRQLEDWLLRVGFQEGDDPGRHGHIDSTLPPVNGIAGREVVHHYLTPLGLRRHEVAFADVYPIYMLKYRGKGKGRREQGDAIRDDYDPIAPDMGLKQSTLPARIPSGKLPAAAAARFGDQLRRDLQETQPELVITLGKEVWETILLVLGGEATSPVRAFEDLYGDHYGSRGRLKLGGRPVEWLPLIHPGLIGGAAPAGNLEPQRRTVAGWNDLHTEWIRRTGAPGRI